MSDSTDPLLQDPLHLGTFGVWLHPKYDDDTREKYVIEAESLGYTTAWLGIGRAQVEDLAFVERLLEATTTIIVATGIVNMWNNDADEIARSYQRIAARHGSRFLLGVGIGHPESIADYSRPYATMVDYLDRLDAGGVPRNRRVLAALGPRAMRLSADRAAGTHPYLVVPAHTRDAREIVGPGVLIAPEHKVVLERDPELARAIGRPFVVSPYLRMSNYTNNLRRYGYSDADIDGASDRLIDALVLHGEAEEIVARLSEHLEAGADHVSIQALTANDADPMPAYRQLAAILL